MKKRGFTLFELLITIAIIGIIGVSAITVFVNSVNSSNQSKYNTTVAQIKAAAKIYVETDKDLITELNSAGTIDVTVGELQEKGLVRWDLKNPLTDKNFSSFSIVRINKTENNNINYEFFETAP